MDLTTKAPPPRNPVTTCMTLQFCWSQPQTFTTSTVAESGSIPNYTQENPGSPCNWKRNYFFKWISVISYSAGWFRFRPTATANDAAATTIRRTTTTIATAISNTTLASVKVCQECLLVRKKWKFLLAKEWSFGKPCTISHQWQGRRTGASHGKGLGNTKFESGTAASTWTEMRVICLL